MNKIKIKKISAFGSSGMVIEDKNFNAEILIAYKNYIGEEDVLPSKEGIGMIRNVIKRFKKDVYYLSFYGEENYLKNKCKITLQSTNLETGKSSKAVYLFNPENSSFSYFLYDK